ncbi:hypothetical protein EWM64_g9960 [Hericium alpestre]|uniref:Uncharacterized protein n=1 Tax=Hericium alpestre TaxID=135208 RepID=A0A4Y9ZHE6_9AGAM|nr:hypothetical protein EWM64_g9960 [Hericium alpestre]
MTSGFDGHGPMYISPRSADVILSDIRPITFKPEALHCLNALLDELLCSLLSVARSLNTERLKLGLHKVLPTPLGKEALLEAEVELRAYWERTGAARPGSAHGKAPADADFNLQWATELMRLKCEAYSTLNDSDEDALAESRINESLGQPGKKSAQAAPAALYLTAILESICEHILSNVGRVATRDSSSTTATLHDLFIALCEDDSMYTLFKAMKVYEQIEFLTKRPTSRRSKSISRSNDRRDSPSPLPDVVSLKEFMGAPSTRSRISSESSLPNAVLISTATRPSLEKARAIKLFKAHNRTSSEREVPPPEMPSLPRKPESASIDGGRRSLSGHSVHDGGANGLAYDVEDEALDQEFDDLMRSGDTMKMSLTPDRLKSMEVYNKERQRVAKQASLQNAPITARAVDIPTNGVEPQRNGHPSSEGLPGRNGAPRPSLRHVDSIIEDDEEPKEAIVSSTVHKPNPSPASIANPPPTASAARLRSLSQPAAVQNGRYVGGGRKTSLSSHPMPPPISTPPMRDPRLASKQTGSLSTPKRTRKIQRNRESLDLDDIMNGSDDEILASPEPSTTAAATPRQTPYVSRAARELISFLEDGPPPEIQPQRPAAVSMVSLTPTTKSGKGGNRLQRIMSKLSLNGNERSHTDSPKLRRKPSVNYISTLSMPAGHAPSRRPPIQYSPPVAPHLAPSRSGSLQDNGNGVVHVNGNGSVRSQERQEINGRRTDSPHLRYNRPDRDDVNGSGRPSSKQELNGHRTDSPLRSNRADGEDGRPASGGSMNGASSRGDVTPTPRAGLVVSPRLASQGNGPPSANSERASRRGIKRKFTVNGAELVDRATSQPPAPSLSEAMAIEMRRVLSKATTADECRLLVDMFFARAGLKIPKELDEPTPDPGEDGTQSGRLEHSLVEHLLGEDTLPSSSASPSPSSSETELRQPSTTDTNIAHEDGYAVKKSPTSPVDTHLPFAIGNLV